ncbi:MAG TPA: LysM peptidoglycan-binding domain-containing protein [Elusimicrobiales bacterium]|nr:LysM peptidoglycan-binding domain-containing protein [Elusimicrobiales bacterium]
MKALLLCAWLLALAAAAAGAEELQTVVVRPGDTLWSLSNTYLKDPTKWNQILKYNKLPSSDPSIALPGMSLKVPVVLIKEQYRAAKLIFFLNDVLSRRSGAEDWNPVSLKMDLFKSDTLRTRVDSRADVKFYTGELLSLYANSIAVLRPPGKKNTDVELMAGELRGLRARVVTASARITPKTKDTEFGARIKEDLTTLVQVYKGKADVEAQGKTIEVKEGFATEVKLDMPPSAPVELPPLLEFDAQSQAKLSPGSAPKLSMAGGVVSLNIKSAPKLAAPAVTAEKNLLKEAPAVGNVNDKRLAANDLLNVISVANPVQGYHLQIAKDQAFTAVVLNRTVDAFEAIDVNDILAPGNYWMRLALVDLLGFEGKFNTPRQISVGKARGN